MCDPFSNVIYDCAESSLYATVKFSRHSVLRQSATTSVSEYSQEVCRAGCDGDAALCLCLFCPDDSSGMIIKIKRANVSREGARGILATSKDNNNDGWHLCISSSIRLQRRGVTLDMVPGVIAGISDLGVISRGPHCASRFSVRPGEDCAGPSLVSLTPLAIWLWEKIIVPKFEACPAGRFCCARAFARDLCTVAPHRDLDVAGPVELFDALPELFPARLIEGGTAEMTDTLYYFEVFRFELLHGASSTANAFNIWTDDVEAEHIDNLQDARSFFDNPGCVHRERCRRFGTDNERDADFSVCGCSFCLAASSLQAALS